MFYKFKLINKNNILYAIFICLYKFLNLKLFYNLSIFFFKKNIDPKKTYKSFLKKIELLKIDLFKSNKKNVLEIGGGNFFGLFPIFLKYKCLQYINIDPYVRHDPSKSKFLFKLLQKRTSEYIIIKPQDLKKFKQIQNINQIKNKNYFDIVVSLSCLEHVKNLEKLFLKLSKITKKKHTQLHIINFSNHLSKAKPFKYLYDSEPKKFKLKFQNNLNCKRIDDYEDILKKLKFNYKFLVIDKENINLTDIHSYWKKLYKKDVLEIRTAILFIYGRE